MPLVQPSGGHSCFREGARQDNILAPICGYVDAPGPYIVKHSGLLVSRSMQRPPGTRAPGSLAALAFDTRVHVREVASCDGKVRGRIEAPFGWISLASAQDGHRWAKPLAQSPNVWVDCAKKYSSPPSSCSTAASARSGARTRSNSPAARLATVVTMPSTRRLATSSGRSGTQTRSNSPVARLPTAMTMASETAFKSSVSTLRSSSSFPKTLDLSSCVSEPPSKVGQAPGVDVWRIDGPEPSAVPEPTAVPDFSATDYPSTGRFYKCDAYIVLETRACEKGNLARHIYLWFGSQVDLIKMRPLGYAAMSWLSRYFSKKGNMEFDTWGCNSESPALSREVMGFESMQFYSLFHALTYIDGSSYMAPSPQGAVTKPRLWRVFTTRHGAIQDEVKVSNASLNECECFVLDTGSIIYVWHGKHSAAEFRRQAEVSAERLAHERTTSTQIVFNIDDTFWQILGGKAVTPARKDLSSPAQFSCGILYEVTHNADPDEFVEVTRGNLNRSFLEPSKVMIVDFRTEVCLWIGRDAQELRQSLTRSFQQVHRFLQAYSRDPCTPIHVYQHGSTITNPLWKEAFSY